MLVDRLLGDAARSTPDAVAILETSRSVTFAELERLTNQFANVCRARGAERGHRVVVAAENSIEFVAAYLGAMRAGAVAVPLAAGPRNDRFARVIRDCSPSVCLVDANTGADSVCRAAMAQVPAIVVLPGSNRSPMAPMPSSTTLADALASSSDAPPPVRAIDQDLAAIIYTSGSTGEPRGVMLTHRNIVANTRSIAAYLELTARDRAMCVLPLYYVYGLSVLHTHLAVGGSVVLDNRFTFPNLVLDAMRDRHVTNFAGVPSTFALLLQRSSIESMAFPDLRYVTQAGGGMPPARILEWLERGPKVPFFVMYGATEATARLTYLDPSSIRKKLGSIGRAIPDVEVRVLKDDGTVAEVGDVGELVARGSSIACGYWNDPEETARRFGPAGYRTGDLGYADEDGYLFLVGRTHEMIKTGAHRVGPREIEDVLHQHPSIQEAAVIGEPHGVLGEVPVAFVALRDELANAQEALRTFCAARLPAYKVPARVLLMPQLPRIPGIDKLDKITLRRLLTEAPAPTRQ